MNDVQRFLASCGTASPAAIRNGSTRTGNSQRVAADLGPQARARRLARGVSQVELAHRAGVPRAALYKWEAGTRSMDLPSALRLVRALGTTLKGLRLSPEGQEDDQP